MKNFETLSLMNKTLSLNNSRAYLFESMFIILAVAFPSLCHLIGAPVRYILPMHWMVILAGLVYGWKGGAISGLISPLISFLVTGMPYPALLIPMTSELTVYGFLTGCLKGKIKLNPFVSVAVSLICGRVIYALAFIQFNINIDLSLYFMSALMPGILTGIIQVISLPYIAKFWTK